MKIKVIKTEQDYQDAIFLLEKIGDDPAFSDSQDLKDNFELLQKLINDYEEENYSIGPGNPIEIIKLKMDYMDLKQKDLIGVIGSKGVVSDVLNKKRGLSKTMIRNLSDFLNISQEILNIDYDLNLDKEDIIVNKKEVKEKGVLRFLTPTGIDTSSISNRIKSRGVTLAMCN